MNNTLPSQYVMKSQYDEVIETVVRRFELIDTLYDQPRGWSTLMETLHASRGTIHTTLAEFQKARLVEQTDDGYTLTGVGRFLVDSYRAELADSLTAEEIAVTRKRNTLLAALQSGPLYKRDIVDRLDISRSTVYRAIDELETAGLVTQQAGGWVTTDAGDVAIDCYRAFLDDAHTILSESEFFEHIPADCGVPLVVLRDNHGITAADQYRLADHITDRVQTADCYRALLPRIDGTRHIRQCHALVTRHDSTVELLVPTDVLVHLREEFPHLSSELATTDGFHVRHCEIPPFGLLLMTNSDERAERETFGELSPANIDADETTSMILVYYGGSNVMGFVDSSNDVACEWANDYYGDMRAGSDEVTGKFQTDVSA